MYNPAHLGHHKNKKVYGMRERFESIAEAEKEIKRLRRENGYLKRRLHSLSPREVEGTKREEELFFTAGSIDRASGYFGYLLSKFKLSFIYKLYDKLFYAIRKYLLASRIWKNILIFLALFGTSIQALLSFGAFLVIFPAVLAAAAIFMLISFFAYRKAQKELFAAIGEKIYFLYLRGKKESAYFCALERALSRDGDVFVVTPYFSLTGFSAVKKRAARMYFIHTSFYFRFSSLAEKRGKRIVKIY